MDISNASRRSFIKQCVIGGVAVYSAPLLWEMSRANASIISPELAAQWQTQAKGQSKPKFRNDGIAKVTGQKVYGRDYRAMDMAGWPKQQGYAFILRAADASHIYQGFSLEHLPASAKPYKVITAADLARDKVNLPEFYGDNMLLPEGQTAAYLGHAVAILLFDNFHAFKQAKSLLQFDNALLRYGEKTPFVSDTKDPYASWRLIRVEGENGAREDVYSPLHDGLFFPNIKNHQPEWSGDPSAKGTVSERGLFYAGEIEKQIESAKESQQWQVLEREYRTQIIDPMMMEPEAFNGWFDASSQTFHTVITSQSPQDFQEMAVHMLSSGPLAEKVKNLVVHSPYIGGGFGAKDHSIFPYYGVLATIYANGPVRLANDRFEQFQSGLKRHPFIMKSRLAVDKATLKIQALTSQMTVDGGGRVNFSPSVTSVGATAMQSIYYTPRNDIIATSYASRNPDAGSMRGYGTLQSMTAMEGMIHEIAAELNVDPFKLRAANVMESGQRNTQGAIPNGTLRYREMLDMAEQAPVWQNRAAAKANYEAKNPGMRYGVGFGIATKDYGTGAAAPSAAIRLAKDGKITLEIGFIEMGTGTQTSQAVVVSESLGNFAHEVKLAEIDIWDAMQLVQTDNPYIISQQRQDEMAANPRWTPVKAMASSASMSAYYQSHVTRIAADIIYRHGLWPAAVSIWNELYFNTPMGATNLNDSRDGRWTDGKLTAMGFPPLSIDILAKRAHDLGLVVGVMGHAFNRWAWAEADFEIFGTKERIALDALALQYGEGDKYHGSADRKARMSSNGYHLIDRQAMSYPKAELNNAMVTYYAPCATLVEIAVNEGNGEVSLLSSHTWLEAGKVIVNELVEGQIQGGLAMGIGHALHEELPPFEAGAGNGTWNINRYKVPLARHVGVWGQQHTILPQLSETDPSRGIAEVVMIPVVSALVEAVYQATAVRFYELPMTAKKIKEAMA
ncbi:xanthine dehydrogenase family protein molybdopterin-binding subunit [Shewanella frigidimarina]|uniref:Xanthine dehydrogenase n=1 Tax=Shewanella frigidimarina TaxID=56812 RepID=A0A106BYZ7_SHEFR|nr:molybdopterin cofactor-binding domain-containing protein [Shewanella frigidimarina]KVX01191.1 xanthine dehydrogenase [Shewanella frigidimarina]